MSTELATLVRERGIIKGSLTRHHSFFDSIASGTLDDIIIRELEARLCKIEQLFDKFTTKQDEIELCELADQELNKQLLERDNFEKLYFALVANIQSKIASFYNNLNALNDDRSASSVHTRGDTSVVGAMAPQVRPRGVELPALKLPNFNGQFDAWLEFRDGFKALIEDNAALSNVQKFYYLRSCLGKDALALIESIQVTEGNYQIAWDLLHDRYEQKALLIHNHIRALFEYPAIESEKHTSLRTFFDTLTKNLRALKVLGEDVEKWDRLLIYLFTTKLDKTSRREWELFKISNDLPTMSDFNTFLKQRCEFLEKIEVSNKPREPQDREFKKPPSFKYQKGGSYFTTTPGMSCYFCKEKHSIFQCEKFFKFSPSDRCYEIRKAKLCKNCLRPGHDVKECMHSGCKKCNRRHNTLLHIEFCKGDNRNTSDDARVKENSGNNQSNRDDLLRKQNEAANKSATFHAYSSDNTIENEQVLLSTAIVYVENNQGEQYECRALLDSGSQSNFITERLSKKLNLAMEKVNYKIVGVGGSISNLNNRASLNILSCTSNYKATIECLVLKRITDKLPTVTFNKNNLQLPSHVCLADNNFNKASDVDLLIGSSLFWELLQGGKIQVKNSKIFLQETLLGWVVGGVTSSNEKTSRTSISCFSSELKNEITIDKLLVKFWEIEDVHGKSSSRSNYSEEEIYCEDNFEKTIERNSDGKFIVSIPFKDNFQELGDSKGQALKRYFLQEQRLSKNAYLKKEYDKFMLEYLELGHMTAVTEQENKEISYYMPHHAVVRDDSKTTKVRVVFDASMKTNSGLSLNEVQCVGPTIQDDLFSIVLRFRKHKYVMTADVSKMYRMILVKPDQCSLQRIFWRQDPAHDLKCYELNTVTYGTASAPYLAVRCLNKLADDFETTYPKASESIKNSFYVDDFLEGANSKSELLTLQAQVTNILASGGFQLRKWLCNKKELLTQFRVDETIDTSILNICDNETSKTLGILWDSNSDTIQYSAPNFKNPEIITKRTILSSISQIYDPLHLLGPVILVAKLLMQSLWQGNFGWDEELPRELVDKWLTFKNNLPKINDLKIPRIVITPNYVTIELHGFGDASQRAYGCCLYIRCKDSSGSCFTQLLCAKSRVAPIKKLVTLPRLELCAAVLLAQLAQKAIDSLKINFDKFYFYSDSQIALSWIRGPASKWKLFVANRVSEIQELTNIKDWYHVSTDYNPADLVSRGLSVNEMTESKLWWNGPEWLYNDPSQFEIFINKETLVIDNLPEQKVVVHAVVINDFDIFSRFSSLNKLKRVFAYCLRFIRNSQKIKSKRTGLLSCCELNESVNRLVSLAQQELFPTDFELLRKGLCLKRKSNLLSLNPKFENGLIRVGGRLQHSNHDYDKRYPIILPSKHILTELILVDEHKRLMHCGPTMLLASIRERFWPISGRNSCKKIIRQCVTCFKVKPTSSTYIMGNLPDSRVTPYLPFINSGCDFAGPFMLKDRLTRGAKLTKGYVCIFICLSSKAIHLEVMSDLTTKCFLAAFRRFVGRRGKPHSVYSDNGKTFICADKELQRLHEFLLEQSISEQVMHYFTEQNITWHFIPSRAPNFGGIWEAGVKSFKFHFKRVVGSAHLHFKDFNTVLVQVESILNSRPLCPLSPTPDQLNPLTPAHFLLGRSITALPDQNVTEVKENRLKRFERLQQIVQHFWYRWKKEYLGELQVRTKWKQQPEAQFKVGSVVLLAEDNSPPLKWPMAKIETVHPGRDGVIRVVTLRINNKLYKRPVTKICILPIDYQK